MRFPGDPDNGAPHQRAVRSPAEATTAGSDAPAASAAGIFPSPTADTRIRQLQETWQLLFRDLRGPVDSTLLGGLSAGDVAYRLGELVHNYFRTRGVTLTSFELRRIVGELLDNHKRGWPTLTPASGPGAPPSNLVDFVDGDPDARAIREAAARPPQPAAPQPAAPPVIEAIPSPLVEVQPRTATAQPSSADAGTPAQNAAPAAVAPPQPAPSAPPPPLRRRPPPGQTMPEAEDTLTPEQLARMEAAAADAAEKVYGAEEPALAQTAPAPVAAASVPPVEGGSNEISAEAAWSIIAGAWEHRRAARPLPASRAELGRFVSQVTSEALADTNVRVGGAERARLDQMIVDDVFGLGVLEPLLRDADVTSIMVNGPDAVFVERRGGTERVGGFRDAAHLTAVLDRLARFAGKPPSGAAPLLVEGRLPDGGRFAIVSPPLAPSGPHCTITRRPPPRATLDDLVQRDTLSPAMAAVLRAAIQGRLNILVSGRAESGRTTMLSALTRAIAPGERVATVERRPELRLDLGNVVSLVAPEVGPEMVPAIDLSLAIAAASRLRPDRLVIDGLGNGAVAALVTLIDGGRDGVVASCEARSPSAALEELARRIAVSEPHETLASAQRRIAGAFDLVVHLEALRDGTRRVTHIAEVAGADRDSIAGRDLFFYHADTIGPDGRLGGTFVSAGHRPNFLPRLAKLGLDQGVFDPA
ncbi:MAG: CpaF family protein [Reyranellaceae bacterium]